MKTLLIVILVILVGISVWWAWPKSHVYSGATRIIGHYRGLGLPGTDNVFFGKFHYQITIMEDDGHCEVQYRNPGYNDFRGFYDSGILREEGRCFVELELIDSNSPPVPLPNQHNIQFGRYYKPDGTLGSEVKDGTGVQTYWTLDGTKIWELELRNFKRVRHSMWYPNGQLLHTNTYIDGKRHGPFVTYHLSGTKKIDGAYFQGDRSGKWVRYNEDGTVRKVEDYTALSGEPSSQSQPSAGSD